MVNPEKVQSKRTTSLRKVGLSFSLSTDPEKEDSEGPLGGLMIGGHYALNLTSKSDRYWSLAETLSPRTTLKTSRATDTLPRIV